MATLKVPVTAEDHSQGSNKASVILVEYGDYQCPYCGKAYPIIKRLQTHFGDKLRFVFRNFPLSEVHPLAEPAAEAAEFAAENKQFWEMHDLIYENQERLSLENLLEIGESLELPDEDLELAIENQQYSNKIHKDFLGGVKSGVNGTPTFFINGSRYDGAYEFEDLVSAIETLISESSKSKY